MGEAGQRILEGLRDAARIAACEHATLPFAESVGRTVWICSKCGGRFNRDPQAKAAFTSSTVNTLPAPSPSGREG